MGINMRVFCLYGIDLSWDEYENLMKNEANYRSEDFNEFKDHFFDDVYDNYGNDEKVDVDIEPYKRDMFVLVDGMCGKYVKIGIPLFMTDDFRYCDGDGETNVVLDLLPEHIDKMKDTINKDFCKLFTHITGAEYDKYVMKLMMFVHYS